MPKAETFRESFETALKAGSKAWKQLTEQYYWTRSAKNLEEVQKLWPEYSQAWARVQIMRVYNVDPNLYAAIAARLGGCEHKDVGEATVQMINAGVQMIDKVGIAEAYRAFREVPRTKMAALASKIQHMNGPDDLREEVDRIAAETRSAARRLGEQSRAGVQPEGYIDFRREYWKLMAENTTLRKENDALRARVGILESRMKSAAAKIREEFNAKIEELVKA